MDITKNFLRTILAALAITAAGLCVASAAEKAAPAPSRAETIGFYFNRTVPEIESLRVQGYGYGEIVKILVIAEMSRKDIPSLLKENKKGYGWGTLSGMLGLKVAYVKIRVDEARRSLKISVHPEVKKGTGN